VNSFVLDPTLQRDTHFICEMSLSTVLLMDDARFPWLIVVPRVVGARDLIDLDEAHRIVLWREVARASEALRTLCTPHKLNVAALGNVVEQLHVHVIARFRDDAAWPRPVWGTGTAQPYAEAILAGVLGLHRAEFARANAPTPTWPHGGSDSGAG